jgi:hypothetical protein
MYRHGLYTKEAIEERRFLRELLQQSRQSLSLQRAARMAATIGFARTGVASGAHHACLSHVKCSHADLSVSLRQVWEEVKALRNNLGARDIKGEVPYVRQQESVPGARQRFRGHIQQELELEG